MSDTTSDRLTRKSFRIGQWQVEPLLGRLSKDGRRVHLEPKPMQVLCYLAENAPEPVTRAELLAAIWPESFSSDQALTRCMTVLRRALDDSRSNPQYIQTLPKIGYRLVAPVSSLVGPEADGDSRVAARVESVEISARGTEQLGACLADSPDHIYLFTPDGSFASVNAAGAQAFGRTPAQLRGRHWRDLKLPEEALAPLEKLVRQAVDGNLTQVGRVSQASIFGDQAFEYAVVPMSLGAGAGKRVLAVIRSLNHTWDAES